MTVRVIASAALALGVVAAPAAAATVQPLKACYASTGPAPGERADVTVAGDGFAPLSRVEVLVDGLLAATPPTGSIGEFEVRVDAPYQPRAERLFTVTVRDPANPAATTVTLRSRVTNLAVTMHPRTAAPSRRVRLKGRGFMLRGPVFAHYLFDGHEQRTVRLARRTEGACGRFSVRRRQIPIEHPRSGRWIVQVDQKRGYSPEPDPVWVRVPIDVSRVFVEP